MSITYHAKWLGSVWSTFRNPGGPKGRRRSLMPNSPNLTTSAQHSLYSFAVLVIKTIKAVERVPLHPHHQLLLLLTQQVMLTLCYFSGTAAWS